MSAVRKGERFLRKIQRKMALGPSTLMLAGKFHVLIRFSVCLFLMCHVPEFYSMGVENWAFRCKMKILGIVEFMRTGK